MGQFLVGRCSPSPAVSCPYFLNNLSKSFPAFFKEVVSLMQRLRDFKRDLCLSLNIILVFHKFSSFYDMYFTKSSVANEKMFGN